MYTDYLYTSGVDRMAKLMVKNKVKTYMYLLNYTIDTLNKPLWTGLFRNNEKIS